MGIQQRFCGNHSDRPAIGVCVITQLAICAECSTRYEGVNYSREGLRILKERRGTQESAQGMARACLVGLVVLSPMMLMLMYWSYAIFVDAMMNVMHWG